MSEKISKRKIDALLAMAERGTWIRFPHAFKIYRDDGANQVPPTTNKRLILEGSCNVQVGNSGSLKNVNEAMLYDYILFHKEELTEPINVEDTIECDVLDGQTIQGIIKKSISGQISKRIWFNELSK